MEVEDIKRLSGMLGIANRAIEAEEAEQKAKTAKRNLQESYSELRPHGERPARLSAAWEEMKAATRLDYDLAQKAKREAYNARRRLATAVKAHRRKGA